MLSDSIGLEFDSSGLKRQFKTNSKHHVSFAGIQHNQINNTAFWEDSLGLNYYFDGVKLYDNQNQLIRNFGQFGRYTLTSLILPLNDQADSLIFFRNGLTGFNYVKLYPDSNDKKLRIGKENLISNDTFCNQLLAIRHANNRDWWVITHQFGNNLFWVIPVVNGKVGKVKKIPIGGVYVQYSDIKQNLILDILGRINVSESLNRIVTINSRGLADVFDFDNCTGNLSNHIALAKPHLSYPYPVGKDPKNNFLGCAFSPNGQFVYITSHKYVYQYDLKGNINKADTIFFLDKDFPRDPWLERSFYFYFYQGLNQLQLNQDGKIYMYKSVADSTFYKLTPFDSTIGVINEPNKKGRACRFVHNQIPLQFGARTTSGMNVPAYADDLPLRASAGLSDTVICPGDTVRFFNNSCGQLWHEWDFGTEKDTTMNTKRVFTKPGVYKIKLHLYLHPEPDVFTKEMTVRVKDCLKGGLGLQLVSIDTCNRVGVQFESNFLQGKPDYIEWNFGDGTRSNELNPYHIYTSAGTYEPTLLLRNGEDTILIRTEEKITVEPCPQTPGELKLYPNPNTGSFILEYPSPNDVVFEVYNVLGQLIARHYLDARIKKHNINLFSVTEGVYFYRLIGTHKSGKIVIFD